ncbi:MAG: T9SS type A sorting domain-containing protein [Bacteroidales bacterium]|nr:T9SS type A sorting domain-containing protein [Bacteroidales bacterium]MCF8405597.1 T9SS type A sorting domain-containing protein [Bacteroidales bacterium]
MKRLIITLAIFAHLGLYSQETVIAGWTFPESSSLADLGITENLDKNITTAGGTSNIEFKNGYSSKAAQATHWDNGEYTKAWIVEFTTTGYSNLTISSMQQSGGNEPGPKYFQIQYSLNLGSNWFDVGSEITVSNIWEDSFVDKLSLPEACDNQPSLMVRWLMTSNESTGVGGDPVLETGKSKIDEIYIRGILTNSTDQNHPLSIKIGPNPCRDFIWVDTDNSVSRIEILDLNGRVLIKSAQRYSPFKLGVPALGNGMYFMILYDNNNTKIVCEKIVKRK